MAVNLDKRLSAKCSCQRMSDFASAKYLNMAKQLILLVGAIRLGGAGP